MSSDNNDMRSSTDIASTEPPPGLTVPQVQRAISLSYAQAMFGSIYGASTGGMFLIGYALMLGASNVQIGLMSSIPMCCIGVQLLAAAMVERGVSRRGMTVYASFGNVLGWLLIILIPYVLAKASSDVKLSALIAIITVVTLFAYVAGNARGSWVGDLIPSRFRGSFFGRITMYAGIIGAIFAIMEGRFLDMLKDMGIGAFSCLFGFGVLVGIANVILFMPQADVPLPKQPEGVGFWHHVKETLRNRPLLTVMLFALLWSMQSIAGPFFGTYMIRDLKMSFLGIGLVNSVVIVAMLLSGPFWGRMVDRYGCRAVLTACSLTLGSLQLIWLLVDNAAACYRLIPPVNFLAGLSIGGVSVALSTLVYKVTPSAGRSIQFAVYSVVVTLAAAPMPLIGGSMPDLFSKLLPGCDLRITFYSTVPFLIAAALVARHIREPDSCRTRDLIKSLPGHMVELWQKFVPSVFPFGRGVD